MANFVHTGAVGFNRRPNPHSAPFWDTNDTPTWRLTQSETEVLQEWWNRGGSRGPPAWWLESQSSIVIGFSGRAQRLAKFLEEQSMRPGVMSRLQPREDDQTITLLHSNPQLLAKYFPRHFPHMFPFKQSTGDVQPVLSPAQAKEKNLYYPDQPEIIMMAPLKVSVDFPKRQGVNGNGPMVNIVSFFKTCSTEIREQILGNLDYTSKAMLSQTCLEMATFVSEFSTFLDVGSGDFHGGEYTPEEFHNLQIAGEVPIDAEQRGSKYVLLSQTRLPYGQYGRPCRTYYMQAEGLGRALRYFLLNGKSVQQLTISGIPFFDLDALAAVCGLCPNLQKCTVLKTELIRFHDLPRFFAEYVAQQKQHVEFDIAPLYESGSKWSNEVPNGGRASTERKGTFGVTHSDSGVKTNVAIVQFCVYSLFPALKAAGQEHMFYNGESLLRQWLEAQALPSQSVFRTILVFEAKQRRGDMTAEVNRRRTVNDLAAGWSPRSDRDDADRTTAHWPASLRKEIARMEVEISFLMAKAMFGEDMWVETFDRSSHANNYRCSIENYSRWGKMMECCHCKAQLEGICFGGSQTCDDCCLKAFVAGEKDHLKKLKLRACSKLGFYKIPTEGDVSSFATLAESNFPTAEAFLESNENWELVPITKTKSDLCNKVLDSPDSRMRDFFDAVCRIDRVVKNATPAGPQLGRVASIQVDHSYGGYEPLHTDPWIGLRYKTYRQAPTKEEYLKCGPGGWTDKEAKAALPW